MEASIWLNVAGAVVVIGGALGVIAKFIIRPLMELARETSLFLRDWNGFPERPGHDEQPGVMARLSALEHNVAASRAQLETNGGSSLKDAVHRLESGVTRLQVQLDSHLDSHAEAIASLADALPVVARSTPPRGE